MALASVLKSLLRFECGWSDVAVVDAVALDGEGVIVGRCNRGSCRRVAVAGVGVGVPGPPAVVWIHQVGVFCQRGKTGPISVPPVVAPATLAKARS